MWIRVLVIVLATGCTTTRGARQGISAGGGMLVGGLVLVAAGSQNDQGGGPNGPQTLGALSLGTGLVVIALSMIAMAPASMHESNERSPRQPATPAVASPRPRSPARIEVPLGATIRAEGSECTGTLDRCAVGLACLGRICQRPATDPQLQPRD